MAAERGNPVTWNNLGSLYASKVPELGHRWTPHKIARKGPSSLVECRRPISARVGLRIVPFERSYFKWYSTSPCFNVITFVLFSTR